MKGASYSPQYKRVLVLGLCLVLTSLVSPSQAEGSANRRELRYTLDEPWIDAVVVGTGFTWWAASEALRADLTPSNCRWCNPPGVDTSVRDAMRWSNTRLSNKISNVLAYGVVPLSTGGLYAINAATTTPSQNVSPWSDFTLDLLTIAEATALAADVNQIAKIWVARQRPSVHAAAANNSGEPQSSDDNRSFYSAHTNTAMAIAVSACTVGSMRGYGWAPVLCLTLPSLALGAGYLRVASDNHYFTDVVVGALAGASFGFAVPYLLHRPRGDGNTSQSAGLASFKPYLARIDGGFKLGVITEF